MPERILRTTFWGEGESRITLNPQGKVGVRIQESEEKFDWLFIHPRTLRRLIPIWGLKDLGATRRVHRITVDMTPTSLTFRWDGNKMQVDLDRQVMIDLVAWVHQYRSTKG